MDQDALIECLKTIRGVRSVYAEDICTPRVCVVTESLATAEYIDGLRLLKGLEGKLSGFVVFIELD